MMPNITIAPSITKMTFIETAREVIISRKLGRRRIAWLTRVFVHLISTHRGELRFLDGPGKRRDASCMPQCEGVVRQECAASLRSLRLCPSVTLSPFLSLLAAHPAAIFQSNAKERALSPEWTPRMRAFPGPYSLSTEVPPWHAPLSWHRVASHVWIKRVETSRDNNLRGGTLTSRHTSRYTVNISISIDLSRVWHVCASWVSVLFSLRSYRVHVIFVEKSPFHPTRSYISGYHYTRCHSVTP